MRMSADQQGLHDGAGEAVLQVLGEQAETAGDMATRQPRQQLTFQLHAPGERRPQSREGVCGEGLAAAIAAQYGDKLTRRKADIEARDQTAVAGDDTQVPRMQAAGPGVQGCSRVTDQGPGCMLPSGPRCRLRVQRARSWMRASPSTHSSTASAHSR